MSGPTIVFDLDGTLIDTAPDLVATLNVILTREGLSPLAYDLARNLVGGGAKAMIARGLEAEGRPCPPSRLEELFADFIAHYSEHLTERSQPFPGVTDALDALSGSWLSICGVHEQARAPFDKPSKAPRPGRAVRRNLRTGHLSESKNLIRKFCAALWRRPAERWNGPS